jgi:hypothetical protein
MLTSSKRMPVCLPPRPDELLSSWIGRNAAFYEVPPPVLLQHAAPDIPSMQAADHHLTSDQACRPAATFRTTPDTVMGMTFVMVPPKSSGAASSRDGGLHAACVMGK